MASRYQVWAICALALFGSSLRAQSVATVHITRKPQGNAIPTDFMGLSIQQSAALTVFGPSTSGNTVLFTLMKNLGTGVLRIGGATADSGCWNGEPAPTPSICESTLTSADFNSWAYASRETRWPMILGVSLAQNESPGAPQYILDEVTSGILPALTANRGSSLLALELGNEINLYYQNPAYRPANYGVAGETSDLLSYMTALQGNAATQHITLAAPAYYNPSPSIVTAQLDPLVGGVLTCDGCSPGNLGLVTLHEYPLNLTKGVPTTSQLLAPSLITLMEQIFTKAVSDMQSLYGLSVELDETNSTIPDPGQTGVSDVQASALWALDYALEMAAVGIRRMNFHIHQGSYYDPIVIASPSQGVYSNTVQPEYYAMYAFNAAKGQKFLPATIKSSANIRAYAVSTCPRCAITVYLINKDLTASGSVQVSLSSPGGSASYLELAAPSLTSYAAAVTYGGVQFNNATGQLAGIPQLLSVTPDANGSYTVFLDNAAAGILTIQP